MKNTTLLSFITALFFTYAKAQVLYVDNFDLYASGNLSNDPTGATPGQHGWITKNYDEWGNAGAIVHTITNYTNKGKVLTFAIPLDIQGKFNVRKTDLHLLMDKRTTGYDVVKFELDYYTGPQNFGGVSPSFIHLIDIHNIDLVVLEFDLGTGTIRYKVQDGIDNQVDVYEYLNADPKTKTTLPFNTWITFNIYLDYHNEKVYFETPYLGTVVEVPFLFLSPSTDLPKDYKVNTIAFAASSNDNKKQLFTNNKFDNLKLTALKNVPAEVLSTKPLLTADFKLYPNPAENTVSIRNSGSMFVNQIEIYDLSGKLISTQNFNSQDEIQLTIAGLNSGTYLLHLKTAQGIAVKKLVKK